MVKITVSHFQQRARLGLAESDFLPDLFSVLLRKKDDGSQNKMVKLTVSHFQQRVRLALAESDFLPDL